MRTISMSRTMLVLLLAAAGACVEPPSDAIEPASAPLKDAQAARLAADLSRLVGGEIKPENLVLAPANRIYGVPTFSNRLADRSGSWVLAQVATPPRGHGFMTAVPAPSTWSQSISLAGLDAAVVVSDSATKTCSTAVCFDGGCIHGLRQVPANGPCPQLMCTSSAECSSAQTGVTCLVNKCAMGSCVPQEIHADFAGACPPAECMSDFECGNQTKDCTYKRCDGNQCIPVTVTVNGGEMCPLDQCTDDGSCGGGGGGSIFEDVGL